MPIEYSCIAAADGCFCHCHGCTSCCAPEIRPCEPCEPCPPVEPCEPCEPCAPCPPCPSYFGFSFSAVDAATRAPLPSAAFTLTRNGQTAVAAISDSAGRVQFNTVAMGIYTMQEAITPPGYLQNTQTYTVMVTAAGQVTIDGLPAASFTIANLR